MGPLSEAIARWRDVGTRPELWGPTASGLQQRLWGSHNLREGQPPLGRGFPFHIPIPPAGPQGMVWCTAVEWLPRCTSGLGGEW